MTPERPRYFLTAFALTSGIGALALTAFAAVVDPFGLSPFSIEIRGINSVKIARGQQDRLYRAYDPLVQRPQIILLGTSRLNRAMDPVLIEALTGKRSYVAGLNGASLGELASLLREWLRRGVPLEEVVVDLYYWRIIPRPDNTIAPHRFHRVADFFAVYLSTRMLGAAMDTLAGNRAGASPKHFRRDGFEEPRPEVAARLQEGGFGKWWETASRLVKPIGPDDLAPLFEIRDLCQRYQLRCRFMISPIHPYRLAAFQQDGTWEVLVEMKEKLSAIVPLHDFSRFDPELFHRFCRPTTAWLDPGHFSPETGGRIVRVLFKSGNSREGRDFGQVIAYTANDEELDEWSRAVTAWRTANREFGRIGPSGGREYTCPESRSSGK